MHGMVAIEEYVVATEGASRSARSVRALFPAAAARAGPLSGQESALAVCDNR